MILDLWERCKMDNPSLEHLTLSEYESVRPHIKTFEERIWFGGLSEIVRESNNRGHRGTCGDLEVMLWSMAGRTMITLRDENGRWLSLMVATDDDRSTMGLHERSIDVPLIDKWLRHVADFWDWTGVVPDDSVTLDSVEARDGDENVGDAAVRNCY